MTARVRTGILRQTQAVEDRTQRQKCHDQNGHMKVMKLGQCS